VEEAWKKVGFASTFSSAYPFLSSN
jgi:hypothetical protein